MNNFFFDSIGNLIQKGYFYQFWFFGALIIIYIILPILHKKFLNNKFAVKLVILTITISLIIDILSIIRACMGLSIIQINVIQTFRIWTWFSYFILGGFIGKNNVWNIIINKISLKFNVILFIFSSIIVIIYQLFLGSCIYGVKYAEYFYDNIFTFSWVFLLFLLVNRLSWRKNKLLDFISSNIIGIYIVHMTVIRFLTKIYHFDTIILITLVIGLSILVSYIISKVPIMKKIIQI